MQVVNPEKPAIGRSETVDGTAVLTLAQAPANALTPALRDWLHDRISEAEADDTVKAILIHGAGPGFSVGLEIEEHETPSRGLSLAALCDRVEACTKPVVAALHGSVLAGGLELALAAHYRTTHPKAQIGFPEVKLGVVPCGGGTQRAPRLLGAETALDLLMSGSFRPATHDTLAPLFDDISEAPPREAGLAFCRQLLDSGAGPRPTLARRDGFADFEAYRDALDDHRTRLPETPEPAPEEMVNCVEAAALLAPQAGLDFEAAAYETLRTTPEARALRRAFFAERRAVRAARPHRGKARIQRVAVLGAGPLAAQIAASLLGAGLRVSWGVPEAGQIDDSRRRLGRILDATIDARLFAPAVKDDLDRRIGIGLCDEAVDEADVILFAARGMAGVAADPAIPRLACVPGRVERVALRLMQPVPRARLVEIIEGPAADAADLNVAFQLCERMAKLPVRVKSPGFTVSDRIAAACHRAADALVDAGLSPYEVDAAMLAWGWTRPPFQLRDMLGLDSTVSLIRAPGAGNWSRRMIEAGRKGRLHGGGFYDWDEGGNALVSRQVQDIVNDARPASRTLSRSDACQLLLAALANEGARAIADGWVAGPSDIDIVCLYAFDFPRWKGGPMTVADVDGLFNMVRRMRAFDTPDTPFWTPDPLILDLIKNGQDFASLAKD